MNTLELAEYEVVPRTPAIFRAATMAVLTGFILTLAFICLPLSGWQADQPVTVTAPMLVDALMRLIPWRGLGWLDYDIADQVLFRLCGIGTGMG
ncbi:hypothetical protein, partial [Streptomyces xinghaiensis]